jgi:hypothetical protein
MANTYNYSKRFCPTIQTASLIYPRTRFNLDSCCPPLTYTMSQPTIDLSGIVNFTSTYPMNDTDMYSFVMTNNEPDNLLTTFTKYYKNSIYGYDTGVLAYPNAQFNVIVTPYLCNLPGPSYMIPFTKVTPQAPLFLTNVIVSGSSATLQWHIPESDQYISTITSYIVRYDGSSAVVPTNSIFIDGLSPGPHVARVQASNMAGLGINSVSFAFTT